MSNKITRNILDPKKLQTLGSFIKNTDIDITDDKTQRATQNAANIAIANTNNEIQKNINRNKKLVAKSINISNINPKSNNIANDIARVAAKEAVIEEPVISVNKSPFTTTYITEPSNIRRQPERRKIIEVQVKEKEKEQKQEEPRQEKNKAIINYPNKQSNESLNNTSNYVNTKIISTINEDQDKLENVNQLLRERIITEVPKKIKFTSLLDSAIEDVKNIPLINIKKQFKEPITPQKDESDEESDEESDDHPLIKAIKKLDKSVKLYLKNNFGLLQENMKHLDDALQNLKTKIEKLLEKKNIETQIQQQSNDNPEFKKYTIGKQKIQDSIDNIVAIIHQFDPESENIPKLYKQINTQLEHLQTQLSETQISLEQALQPQKEKGGYTRKNRKKKRDFTRKKLIHKKTIKKRKYVKKRKTKKH
jgi:hypothetical protein